MVDVLRLNKAELVALPSGRIKKRLTTKEFLHIAKTLDAFWQFDYQAAEAAKNTPGAKMRMHAELKSKLHSDGFFVSRIMLQYPNIQRIMAAQLVMRFNSLKIAKPDWVAGIPDGATKLGREVGSMLGAKIAEIDKIDGKIIMASRIPQGETLLLVEDFCTRGTGFIETVLDIDLQPGVVVLPYELVIVNRGGLKEIITPDGRRYKIVAGFNIRIKDWPKEVCVPCVKYGSVAIKPKATEQNWAKLNKL